MSHDAMATRIHPNLTAIEAQLYVADITASCAYFTAALGFAIAFTHGDPPFFGQVYRDRARLNLRMVREPVLQAKSCRACRSAPFDSSRDNKTYC